MSYVSIEPLSIDETHDSKEYRNRVVITSVWNLIVLILSLVTPNITIAIGFLGSLAAFNVFLFPGLCMTALSRRIGRESAGESWLLTRGLFAYGVFIIITSIFMFVVILMQVVNDLTNDNQHELLCI